MIVIVKNLLSVTKSIEIEYCSLENLKREIVLYYFIKEGKHQYKSFDSKQVRLLFQGKSITSDKDLAEALAAEQPLILSFLIPLEALDVFKGILADNYYKVLFQWRNLPSPNKGELSTLSVNAIRNLHIDASYQDEGELLRLQDKILENFVDVEKAISLCECLHSRMKVSEVWQAKLWLAMFLSNKKHRGQYSSRAENIFKDTPVLYEYADAKEKRWYDLAKLRYAKLLYEKALTRQNNDRDALLGQAMCVTFQLTGAALQERALRLRNQIFHCFVKRTQGIENAMDGKTKDAGNDFVTIKPDFTTIWQFATEIQKNVIEKEILKRKNKALRKENELLKETALYKENSQKKTLVTKDEKPQEPIRVNKKDNVSSQVSDKPEKESAQPEIYQLKDDIRSHGANYNQFSNPPFSLMSVRPASPGFPASPTLPFLCRGLFFQRFAASPGGNQTQAPRPLPLPKMSDDNLMQNDKKPTSQSRPIRIPRSNSFDGSLGQTHANSPDDEGDDMSRTFGMGAFSF